MGMSSLLLRATEKLHYSSFSHSFISFFSQYFWNTCQAPAIALGIAEKSKSQSITHSLNEKTGVETNPDVDSMIHSFKKYLLNASDMPNTLRSNERKP